MKKIVVAIDFSPASRKAGEYAAMIAQVMDAGIYLLHVSMEPMPATRGSTPWTIAESDAHVRHEKRMNEEVEFLKNKYPVTINGNIITGFTSDSIADAAKEMNANLVVLGRTTGRKAGLQGSTVLKAIRKTTVPVLIVPGETVVKPIKNIALAVDFKEMADSHSFEFIFSLVKNFDASLRVLHVEEKGADLKAAEVPQKLQLGVVLSKVSYLYDKLESNDLEQGILNYVSNHNIDVLAMVAHHHTIFERLFGTVHTQSISAEIKLPLLVLKDEAPPAGTIGRRG